MTRLPDPGESRCPEDGSQLVVFQPDDRRPARLLAACPGCGAWWQLVHVRRLHRWIPFGPIAEPSEQEAAVAV